MKFSIELPDWAVAANHQLPKRIETVEQRMATVIEFAEQNFDRDTGGPFAAGIFESDTGKVVVIGVNRVVPENNSIAHAEMVSIALAQQILNTFDLGGPGMGRYQLVVNARPCAMCYGSLSWSGIRSLVIGASGDQVESLAGFDEGPIHPDWQAQLRQRGIEVIENVLNERACELFHRFAASGMPVYNGRTGDSPPATD